MKEIVLLDGETKVAKTAISEGIKQTLGARGPVVAGDAGQVFRRFTSLVSHEIGDKPFPREERLDKVLGAVIKSGLALDDTYAFGDLERPVIRENVSQVGERDIAQDAAETWFEDMADLAWEKDASLLLNARNPRARLAGWLGERGLSPTVEFYLQCGPDVAAHRMLRGNGNTAPSPTELMAARTQIVGRRQLDRQRARNPFVEPAHVVPFVPGVTSAGEVVAASWDAPAEIAPYYIGFDTTPMPKDEMLDYAEQIVAAALPSLVEWR